MKFLPSPGRITHLRVPDGPYVRNDSGCYEGAEIPVHYDPMISKLVVWGEDRARAVARMRRALDEYVVRGIETNLAFHRRCLRHDGVHRRRRTTPASSAATPPSSRRARTRPS